MNVRLGYIIIWREQGNYKVSSTQLFKELESAKQELAIFKKGYPDIKYCIATVFLSNEEWEKLV